MSCPERMHTRVDEEPKLDHDAWHCDPEDQVYRLISKCAICGEKLTLDVDIWDDRLWYSDFVLTKTGYK